MLLVLLLLLQTLTTQSNSLPRLVRMTLSIMLRAMGLEPFVNVTAEEFIFGYDDTLVSLAHKFFPKHRRPMSRMGLLLGVRAYEFLSKSQDPVICDFLLNLTFQCEQEQRCPSKSNR
jgi:hypothetical protein